MLVYLPTNVGSLGGNMLNCPPVKIPHLFETRGESDHSWKWWKHPPQIPGARCIFPMKFIDSNKPCIFHQDPKTLLILGWSFSPRIHFPWWIYFHQVIRPKSTWKIGKMGHPKKETLVFQTSIFRCENVSFREITTITMYILPSWEG